MVEPLTKSGVGSFIREHETLAALHARLGQFPRVELSVLPTPLAPLRRLSERLGVECYCKRDDLTGFAFGGNKTRKLDYLIADAKTRRFDTVLAIGANQSNFCRMAAAAAVVCGLDAELVLGGPKPDEPRGNLLIDWLVGARILHIPSEDWSDWERASIKHAYELAREGRSVYRLPVGGSTPLGALGYVRGFLELYAQCERDGIELDTIVHASSSAGTQAGLVVGKALTGWGGRIIGMSVAKRAEHLENEVWKLATRALDLLENGAPLEVAIERKSVIVDDRFMGPTYGARTNAAVQAIQTFARTEGLMLDEVYTGKAAAGFLQYCADGAFDDERVCFLHTGGALQLFS